MITVERFRIAFRMNIMLLRKVFLLYNKISMKALYNFYKNIIQWDSQNGNKKNDLNILWTQFL